MEISAGAPQTLYGIADFPVGLAAYFLDHDAWSYALISRVFAGESAGLTRDEQPQLLSEDLRPGFRSLR
jgi:hypothetical protein